MKIYSSIEEWNLRTSELRKTISKNMINMRTDSDATFLVRSKRIDEVTGVVRFIIDTKKLNDKICIKDLYK